MMYKSGRYFKFLPLCDALIIRVLIVLLFVFQASGAVLAQEGVLADMQGLSYEKGWVFELEGYTISVEKNKEKLNDKGIKRIKKKYDLNNVSSEYSDKKLKWENWVIESKSFEKNVPDVINYQTCYLLPESDDYMNVVSFESLNRRDTILEQTFLNAFFSRNLSQYVKDSWTAEEINFAGRRIPLGNICAWVAPYNVHCPSFGQISWSVFRNKEDAEINNYAHYLLNKKSGQYKVLDESDVDILFEGYQTQAKRLIYKINKSKALLGGRNELAVYYVVRKVRGKYISCVLSHYIEDRDNYRLPPLLEEVMSLPE